MAAAATGIMILTQVAINDALDVAQDLLHLSPEIVPGVREVDVGESQVLLQWCSGLLVMLGKVVREAPAKPAPALLPVAPVIFRFDNSFLCAFLCFYCLCCSHVFLFTFLDIFN